MHASNISKLFCKPAFWYLFLFFMAGILSLFGPSHGVPKGFVPSFRGAHLHDVIHKGQFLDNVMLHSKNIARTHTHDGSPLA